MKHGHKGSPGHSLVVCVDLKIPNAEVGGLRQQAAIVTLFQQVGCLSLVYEVFGQMS